MLVAAGVMSAVRALVNLHTKRGLQLSGVRVAVIVCASVLWWRHIKRALLAGRRSRVGLRQHASLEAGSSWAALSRCTNGERDQEWIHAFRSTRAIFVHVPRCAGTSIEAALFALSFHSQHHTLARLETLLGADAVSPYFRFTIVRDPISRFLSAFAYLRARGQSSGNLTISPHDRLAATMIQTNREWQDDPRLLLVHLAALPSWESVPLHFRPQTYFLGGAEGMARLDVVMRWESLETDLQRVLHLHDFGEAARATYTLPRYRPSGSSSDMERWRTPALDRLVRKVYADDYAILGY